ncbi:MAG TPA: ethanolamine ammonia-lyase subunit EutC [Chitinophagaceae bacterium]|nr:ethanolamine ammonia-lyase subunit EutC [Chitinophagaceae bacterium]
MEKQNIIQTTVVKDSWASLKSYTAARIALGRTGVSVPLDESLQFKMAHAHARDAVYSILQKENLIEALQQFQLAVFSLHSKAKDRQEYLQRPDYGRRLNDDSANHLQQFKSEGYNICITVADGLSATAINEHAVAVLRELIPELQKNNFTIAPLCLVQQGRVAISDETGFLLKAKISLILIGERPGLSSPDSMGAYLTYKPQLGLTDESRNCISNIRPEGLQYNLAAEKIFYLIKESLRLKISGVGLKDNAGLLE